MNRRKSSVSAGTGMKKRDAIVGFIVAMLGIAWFAGAAVAYDGGSPYENRFLREGFSAIFYVPLAAMYLAKMYLRAHRSAAFAAWLVSFIVLELLAGVGIWVTHFKPDCDVCHAPASECLILWLILGFVLTGLASLSDVLLDGWLRRSRQPILDVWLVRRLTRVLGTVAITALLLACIYWIVYWIMRGVRMCGGVLQ